MDVAKYIGLFLLKNRYCCLQGLGNLEIKRTAATHDGSQLNSASYEAIFQATGSIDDALANFMATNEHVSIAKASNEIREFIVYVKGELSAGREVLIPSIGKYFSGPRGIDFQLDPAFSMPSKPLSIPMTVRPPVAEPVAVQEHHSGNSVNWGLIAMWGVILVVVATILFFGIRYFINQGTDSANTEVKPVDSQMVEIATPPVAAPVTDTAATAAVQVADTPEFNFIISSYKNIAAAQRREKQLNGYGHEVHLLTKDSVQFYVVKTLRIAAVDTTRLKDSLSKVLNPSGVTILQ